MDDNEGTFGVPPTKGRRCLCIGMGSHVPLGVLANKKGGVVYVLVWDPMYRRIRPWVFTLHSSVSENLSQAICTAGEKHHADRIMRDQDLWPLPYGYFAIGDNTDCPASHFFEYADCVQFSLCGSAAGNRFQMDCVIQAAKYKTCYDWVQVIQMNSRKRIGRFEECACIKENDNVPGCNITIQS